MVIVICRTRNEEANIVRFCTEYAKIVDKILISDGGSTDNTIEIASSMPKTIVEPYGERVTKNDVWRNPHGLHINHMIRRAKEEGADWILFDDCDSAPNANMKKTIVDVFKMPDIQIIRMVRLYLYKDEGHFENMGKAGFGVWGWRSEADVSASEEDPWVHHMDYDKEAPFIDIPTPNCLLHFFCPNEEEIERKHEFYKKAKDAGVARPTDFGGPVVPLPEWAVI